MGITDEQKREAGAVQVAAAADPARCVRLVAGPGTGKSFTIEERVIRLLADGIEPHTIHAVSFTRASALDLQQRVDAACERAGRSDARIPVTTLHSLALGTLRASGALSAYPADPLVLDEWELKNLFDPEFGRSASIGSVPRRREIRQDHEAFWSTGRYERSGAQRPPDPPISEVERSQFRAFHGPRTQLYSCVLPGELVQKCVERMDAGTLDPVVLLHIEHLIVDEFQDLNPMDLRFVYGLESRGATLFVAGDDDQSLYSFRYAAPSGIQEFTRQFEGAGDHVLEHCFRCTPSVLSAAENLIANNSAPGRIPKRHVSLYEQSDPPVPGGLGCWSFAEGRAEAQAVARSCRRLVDAGMDPRKIMILLSNAQALQRQLAKAFEEHDVPFEPPRNDAFRDTSEGRALLAATRIVAEREDYVALRTLLALRTGVGIGTATGIADKTINAGLNYRDLFYAERPDSVFSGREEAALEAAEDVCAALQGWNADDVVADRASDIDRIIELILGEPPKSDWRGAVEALPDTATIAELARFLSSQRDDERAEILREVYERVGDQRSPEEAVPNRVRMMTMHGSKGLSATVVFIPGLEEELLPGPNRARFPGQVLEAARMLYVSITRARLACVLSYSRRRFINGSTTTHTPSRFTGHVGKPFRDGGVGITEDLARRTVAAAEVL